jgi:hypothetical protein
MEGEDEYFIPLQDQRVFGAGIKRKRVAFIPPALSPTVPPTSTSATVGDRYLSIVFPSKGKVLGSQDQEMMESSDIPSSISIHENGSICRICNLPIQDPQTTGVGLKPHQALIAHQVCLPHSSPPSHLDRKRKGLKYLASYGWDPDSRLGLGATGKGIRAPIKVKVKNDTVGLGVERLEERKGIKRDLGKVQKLDAKQVRYQEQETRKKALRLQEMFFGNDDVDKYLGNP